MRAHNGFAVGAAFYLALTQLSIAADADSVARGKYLVEEVGKCQDCHTPMTATGELDKTKWLKGATLSFAPLAEVKGWHKTSPDLTSSGRLFQRWGEEKIADFLHTAVGPTGNKADPPMPAYKLTVEDAKAIAAYLKSLP